jgi:hypothetical protein
MPLQTTFADRAAAEAQDQARRTMTPERSLAHELVKMVRNLTITAGLPAHVRPTVWSVPIDLSAQVTVAAAAGPYTAAITYTVPEGMGARIEQYGFNVLDPLYTFNGSILWAFKKNGAFIDQGLTDIAQQRGTMVYPRKTVIILDARDRLQFLVRRAVVAGAPQNVQMGFRGWAWMKRNNFEGTQSSVTAF